VSNEVLSQLLVGNFRDRLVFDVPPLCSRAGKGGENVASALFEGLWGNTPSRRLK